ncbi:MAG: glycosyltransferase family 8 protein [Phascolarctobacterium sp.]|uniref:glycosyltransferase family 8 protein n=1 Tax=Phascolarctobacterium sp. TaxID=2049039 RepID=UPI0026DD1E2F|nr:glycosyltransferase family 8 protein [Phascolarctobacterium sp.]MDO4921595.1 glycosyltransferase family 8 protein [Phascolarctobacterium sp.]
MYIAYHSSDYFSQQTGISMASLFENNKDAIDIVVFVIEHNISETNKKKILGIGKKYKRDIRFIPMPNLNEKKRLGLKFIKSAWNFDSYCRLFLDEILPLEVERVLYLDGDVLVNASLKELWNLDIQGRCAAAVTDSLGEEYYELFNLSNSAHYCNSGVILIDLKKWRVESIGNKIVSYVKKHNGYVFFMEQTVLNAVLDSQLYILPPRYNVFTLMMCLNYKEHMYLRNPKRFYSEGDVRAALANPCLIHLTTCFFILNRAWIENNNHPAKALYLKYAALTPWNKRALLPDTRTFKKKVVDFFVQNLPRIFVLVIARYLYQYIRVKVISKEMDKYADKIVVKKDRYMK